MARFGSLLVLLAAAALLGFAPAPFPKKSRQASQDDAVLIQGTWRLVAQGYQGRPSPSANQKARVSGTTWTFINSGQDGPSYTLTLEQKLSPRAFEWKSGGSVWVGSYRIEGRRLSIVYTSGSLQDPQKRPLDMTGKDSHYLQYERE